MNKAQAPSSTLHAGDSLEVLRQYPDNHFSAVVTDPPYGIDFHNAGWDNQVPGAELWAEALRVLKPGGHLLAFAGTRTQHRMACAIEDAGFEIRDMLAWVYGSGFPKNHDIAKAIDRRRHDRAQVLQVTKWIADARDAAGIKNRDIDDAFGFKGMAGHWTSQKTQPAVPTLEQIPTLLDCLALELDEVPEEIRQLIWDLNGRKGQPGENWTKREVLGERTGTNTKKHTIAVTQGAQETSAREKHKYQVTAAASEEAKAWEGWGTALKPCLEPITLARKPFPSTTARNVLEHGTGAVNVDGCRFDGDRYPTNLLHDGDPEVLQHFPKEQGASSARFFYCAKPSTAERNHGLSSKNPHPTVKPVQLMRQLVRLVTPPGGLVLDPFMGSGGTGIAAKLEGFDFVGIDLSPDFVTVSRDRINAAETLGKSPDECHPSQLSLLDAIPAAAAG